LASGTSFYNSKDMGNVEVATLVKDIPLPKYDKKLEITVPGENKHAIKISFTPKDTVYKAMKGDFYIAIEIPSLDKNTKVENKIAAPKNIQGGNKLNTTSYKTGNTITLEIPKYLVMLFDNKIPKGTKFLVVSLADKADAKNIRIISLYTDAPSQLIDDTDTTNIVMGGGK